MPKNTPLQSFISLCRFKNTMVAYHKDKIHMTTEMVKHSHTCLNEIIDAIDIHQGTPFGEILIKQGNPIWAELCYGDINNMKITDPESILMPMGIYYKSDLPYLIKLLKSV